MSAHANSSVSSPPTRSDRQATRAPIGPLVGAACAGGVVLFTFSMLLYDFHQIDRSSLATGLLFYAVAVMLTGFVLRRSYPHRALGWCNVVTLLRLAMVCVLLIGLFAGVGQSWALFAFAIAALSLDGVDGWLARREDLTSVFGARFDMEVDAIFALILSAMAYSNGAAGIFVLMLGLPSYLFFAAKFAWPWLDQPLPDLFSRKVVCVAQLGVLIALQLPLDLGGVLGPVTLAAAAALVWSFGRDVLWLAQQPK